jgi:hypothetical protein
VVGAEAGSLTLGHIDSGKERIRLRRRNLGIVELQLDWFVMIQGVVKSGEELRADAFPADLERGLDSAALKRKVWLENRHEQKTFGSRWPTTYYQFPIASGIISQLATERLRHSFRWHS